MTHRFVKTAGLLLGLSAAACTTTTPTSFYTLTALNEQPSNEDPADTAITNGAVTKPKQWRIALAPIILPPYLERPQIVTRVDESRMDIADFHSWIEPLDSLIQRTVAANLRAKRDVDQTIRLPQRRPASFDFGVEITIDRFETSANGEAVLDASLSLVDASEIEFARLQRDYTAPVSEPKDYAERSLAMSQLLARLSEDILEAISTR